MGDRYSRPLPGVEFVPTATFRQACALLARARAYLGPEGGLHHACAALRVPAVVIFGGYVSPSVTGYHHHINLFSGSGLGCGRSLACDCSCMSTITYELVVAALRTLLLRVDRSDSSF
ncbi:glycosyltransferase family 9 protein [Paraburkholderia aspalathi]